MVDVAGDQRPIMNQCGCRHQAVNDWHRVRDVETSPDLGDLDGDRDKAVAIAISQPAGASAPLHYMQLGPPGGRGTQLNG